MKKQESLFLCGLSNKGKKDALFQVPFLKEKALLCQKEFEEGDQNFNKNVGWFDKWGEKKIIALGN